MTGGYKELFLRMIKIAYDFDTLGIVNTKVELLSNKVVSDYLVLGVNLIKDAYTPEVINCYSDSELQIILLNNNLDELTIRQLFIVKHSLKYLQEGNIDDLICSSRPYMINNEYVELWEYIQSLRL